MSPRQQQILQREEDELRSVIRRKCYSLSTEESYVGWFRRYAKFLTENPEFRALESTDKFGRFLTMIARTGVARATQKQGFDAIRFYYEVVRREKLGDVQSLRVKRAAFIRVAPSVEDVRALLSEVRDVGGYPTALVTRLLYACGLRLCEPLNARLKDWSEKDSQLVLQGTKGGSARVVHVPCELASELALQVKHASLVWEGDCQAGLPIALPDRLGVQRPARRFSRQWAFLFPGRKPCPHPRTGEQVRYHFHEGNVQRAVADAVKRAKLNDEIVPHLLRHAYGTHAKRYLGADIIDLQRAYGHKNLQTTMTYLAGAANPVRSPVELLS